jgi:hypothetical protein
VSSFISELGACKVPPFTALGPVKAWKKATDDQRTWVRSNVFEELGVPHTNGGEELCWCGRDVSSADKRRIFAAFLRFKKTGRIEAPAKKRRAR